MYIDLTGMARVYASSPSFSTQGVICMPCILKTHDVDGSLTRLQASNVVRPSSCVAMIQLFELFLAENMIWGSYIHWIYLVHITVIPILIQQPWLWIFCFLVTTQFFGFLAFSFTFKVTFWESRHSFYTFYFWAFQYFLKLFRPFLACKNEKSEKDFYKKPDVYVGLLALMMYMTQHTHAGHFSQSPRSTSATLFLGI